MLQLIIHICAKYENYFLFDGITLEDTANEMVQIYIRLREIYEECLKKKLSDDEIYQEFGDEVEELRYAIKCKEFVCKVSKVAFLDGMKMIAQFWGDYYAEIDFDEVLQLPEVQKNHPDYERLRDPEFFHQVFAWEYHVFFGKYPDRCDVTSHFIWHYGKRIHVDENEYEWIQSF